MYTVKQLSELAGVSVRTLHYYDEIGLLRPSQVGANSYRYYDEAAVLRLQQILFYREIGLELMQIKDVLDSPHFDLVTALKSHRAALQDKSERLQKLLATVDQTLQHLMGETTMSKRQLFEAFSEEKQKDYEREARLQYGPDHVNASIKRWNGYTEAQREAIGHEGNTVYHDLVAAIEAGKSPLDAGVQALLERWHNHIRHFYEPTLDILRGLGETYVSSPDFRKNFDRIDPRLAEFMREGIVQYVDDLETAEIARMLADDAEQRGGA